MKLMKGIFALLLIAVFMAGTCSLASAYDRTQKLRLGKVRDGYIYNGEFEMHYNAKNIGSKDIDGAKVTLWIPDLDFQIRTTSFDLEKKQKNGQFLFLQMKEVKKGTYMAKITLSSDHEKDSKWIWVTIG